MNDWDGLRPRFARTLPTLFFLLRTKDWKLNRSTFLMLLSWTSQSDGECWNVNRPWTKCRWQLVVKTVLLEMEMWFNKGPKNKRIFSICFKCFFTASLWHLKKRGMFVVQVDFSAQVYIIFLMNGLTSLLFHCCCVNTYCITVAGSRMMCW